jgi:transcription-repair coupling factor (superfamily II helicase)
LKSLHDILAKPGRSVIASAPEGVEAWLIARLLGRRDGGDGGPLLLVCRDDARVARVAGTLAFLAPGLEVLRLPAWDCLPYDRVSPHRDIVAQRIDALARLMALTDEGAGSDADPSVVLTTVSALLQRLPPRAAFRGRVLEARAGETLPPERLSDFLVANGYVRAEAVGEPGEFAVRGGLVDVFPAGAARPLRLDFFGDELEAVRAFDPLTQRSTGEADGMVLRPVSEVLLDEEAIQRFRTGYREAFGAVRGEDPLYESVSEGRLHPGMEHWLPLFYDHLETLLDYLPSGPVLLDHQAEEVRNVRLETIEEFYQARRDIEGAAAAGAGIYHPLPMERLYLGAADWDGLLAERPTAGLTPFAAPEHQARTFDAGGRGPRDFAEARAASDGRLYDAVGAFAGEEIAAGRRVLVAGQSRGSLDRVANLLREHGMTTLRDVASWDALAALPDEAVGLASLALEQGFGTTELTVVTEQDILGERLARPAARRRRPENFLTEVAVLHAADLVVHSDHGIGRYEGLETLEVGGAPHDCLRLVYAGGDKLFVPVENIEVLSRFGSEDAGAELDRLGQAQWQARKGRVKERIRDIAQSLIRLAAARALKRSEPLRPPEGIYDEFCARFPYPETDDQLRAIDETLADLAEGRPMDRLICGDVGFGKTEVALRAVFVAVMSGWQAAIIVPTTLLARQHYQTFRARFAGLPIRIAQLSRLVPAREAAAVKEELAKGTMDLVIGTHALLGKGVAFKELGLLIVDEEQHFGVKQKERLKALRQDVHVLTLTATPIPRTLQLALTGVKDMSLIASPPVDRLAVRTFVLPYDAVVVREAVLRELHRGGQIFYVCPRIKDLARVEERLRALVPEARLRVAHGQLPASELEDVMTDFLDRKFDLLLCTNIIESGLDIQNANTMIIHRADMFGLSQLYQLRGRIGRAKIRGYAYLTLPPGRLLTASAERRLHVMQTLDTLGAGFQLASHDMDIRGAGNLLGEEQSGHIREVGVELYQQLLEEAVAEVRGEEAGTAGQPTWSPQINVGTPVLIPEPYVADLNIRLGLYRRLSTLEERAEIEAFAAELIDRFGPLPPEVDNLLEIMTIKHLCRGAGVEKVEAGPRGAVLSFRPESVTNPEGLIAFAQRQPGLVQLRPDDKLVYRRHWDEPKARLGGVRRLLEELSKIAA